MGLWAYDVQWSFKSISVSDGEINSAMATGHCEEECEHEAAETNSGLWAREGIQVQLNEVIDLREYTVRNLNEPASDGW
jgi:hypothetical protein